MSGPYLLAVPVVESPDGVSADDVVMVEIDPPARGMVPASRVGEMAVIATETLQESLRRVRRVGQLVVEQMSSLPRQPAVVKVEFGVKLSGEASVVITKAAGEANFVISLEWHADSTRDEID
jgi:hypothetical protein